MHQGKLTAKRYERKVICDIRFRRNEWSSTKSWSNCKRSLYSYRSKSGSLTYKRHEQGWVDEVYKDLDHLIDRASNAKEKKEAVSIAYDGNIVDLWEKLVERNVNVELGSDQTSLHNPWAGGYYPVGMSFEESNNMMVNNPEQFKKEVQKTLIRHTNSN